MLSPFFGSMDSLLLNWICVSGPSITRFGGVNSAPAGVLSSRL